MSRTIRTRTLTSDNQIEAGIGLLELLTSADGTLSRARACERLHLTDEQLRQTVELLQTLANRESGSRLIIREEGDELAWDGDAGELLPVRLSYAESVLLGHLLSVLHIDPNTAERIREAVVPADADADDDGARIGELDSYGPFYQQLITLIDDGVRCRITYRSSGESAPRERVIDPHRLESRDGAGYLTAWDIERDAQRRYRLDRIARVETTDDSVVPHAYDDEDIARSLATDGKHALLLTRDAALAARLDWAGLGQAQRLRDGSIALPISYTSEPWLFDHVAAQGGALIIARPRELRSRLCTYLRSLAASTRTQTQAH